MADNTVTHMQHTMTIWNSLWGDHVTRLESFLTEANKLQDQGLAQSKTAAEESAKLFQAWVEYGVALSRDFQKLSLEGAKKSLEMLATQGGPRT